MLQLFSGLRVCKTHRDPVSEGTEERGIFMLENKPSEHKMKKNICTALLAHVDAGKTTLSEGLLYQAGQIRTPGRVDNRDAFLDTYELEKERGITIFSKQAVFSAGDTQITLLDTPGHVDFSAEMERTLPVLDYAVLVISGADGVQGHTETLWRLLNQYQIPVFLFVNKMDQPGTSKEVLLQELKNRLSDAVTDFTDTEDPAFHEAVALCDEQVLNAYLESGELPDASVPVLIRQRKLFPCFFGSALKMQGVKEFLEAFARYTQSPQYPEEFGAKVFKITRDEQGNRLTYVKVTGGTLKARMEVADGEKRWSEKVNQIRIYSGDRFQAVPEAPAGMVCALTGLSQTWPGEGLGAEKSYYDPFLKPVLTYRVLLPDGCDPAVMLPKLKQLEEEEPELHIIWKEMLQEIQTQVMGKVQIEILQRLIKDRYDVDVEFDTGNIVYKETIAAPVEGIGHFEPLRHYAEVHLLIEPGEPGSGFRVAADCSEDVLDKNWQRLILTHLLEKEHCGVLTGSGLTDVKVTLIAGRAHLKHTEGGDFRQATYRALRHGLMQAENVLLEPYYSFRLEVPESSVGRAMTDIERMAGTFSLENKDGGTVASAAGEGMAVLTGEVPVISMRDYAAEVSAYTKGRGRLSFATAGYRPCHNAEEVIRGADYDPEADVDNPAGSVFCAHGAGFYVKWQDVRAYAHIDTGFGRQAEPEEEEASAGASSAREEEWIDIEEIDEILMRTSHANRKGERGSHKGISGKKIRSLTARPEGLSRPRRQNEKREKYLLVDGYNVIFSWPELNELSKVSIDAARGKLMDIMCNYQGFKRINVIVVFDAYRVQNHRTETLDYHNIHVVYTREAETADQFIEKFAHENAKNHAVTVATSDGMEQIIIRGEGCRLLSSRDLAAEIARTESEMREYM